MISPFANAHLGLSSTSPLAGIERVYGRKGRAVSHEAEAHREAIRGFHAEVIQARKAMQEVQAALEARPGRAVGAGLLTLDSTADLGLNHVPTQTTLRSTEEVNTVATSYTPRGPDFTGASTSEATFSSIYNGDQGDDTLSFTVARGGTLGEDRIKIKIRDGAGDQIKQITIQPWHSPGKTYNVGNGLKVSFSAGDFVKNDKFTLDVFTSVGSEPSINDPFNGVRNDDPEFEPGESVGAGSFDVNGTTIAVAADDTLQQIVDRITSNVDGVSATFDAATEKIVVTHDDPGANPVVIDNDDSGFLSATKLDTATHVLGLNDERIVPVAETGPLASIATGTFEINGTTLSVDRDVDSLKDILTRINAAPIGVSASYDDDTGEVTIRSTTPGQGLTLDDGTSGLFSALGIAPGEYAPPDGDTSDENTARRRALRRQARTISSALEEASGHLNKLFDRLQSRELAEDGVAQALGRTIETSIKSSFDSTEDSLRTDFGINFRLGEDRDGDVFGFGAGNQNTFRQAFVRANRRVGTFLTGKPSQGGEGGLLGTMLEALGSVEQQLKDRYGSVGVLVNQVA